MRNCLGVLAFSAMTGGLLLGTSPARAQQEVQVASTAFAEGQQAQLRGDPVRAAELFEIADQAVPSPAALRSAIRNREAAGHDGRAATLSLRAIERYGQDRDTRAFAEEVIARLSPKLGRVKVRCNEPCTATADGGLVGSGTAQDFFLTPGPHTLKASWTGRPSVSRTVELTPGQTVDAEFVAPPPEPEAAPSAAPPAAPATTTGQTSSAGLTLTPTEPTHDTGGGGLSPAVFWIGAGLTAVSGGLLLWSGLDTLSARDDYEDNPTQSGFDDGVDKERRTNILIGTTAVLGAATLGIGLFATDWGGGSSRVSLDAGPAHARVLWTGVLP